MQPVQALYAVNNNNAHANFLVQKIDFEINVNCKLENLHMRSETVHLGP